MRSPLAQRLAGVLLATTLATTAAACGAHSGAPDVAPPDQQGADLPVAVRPALPGQRSVMWVGNNWDGTASIVDANSLRVLKRGVNLVPDKAEETNAIVANPVKLAFFLAIGATAGQGHNQYVDDMFTTMDGKYLAVSRPSFADVVWIDIAKATAGRTDSIFREQQMDGYRTDHMQVSNNGRRLLVSDSTARQVIEYSMVDEVVEGKQVKVGDRLRTFVSGETPHESNYTVDGSKILHASIGRVYTPADDLDASDLTLLGINLTALLGPVAALLSPLGLDLALDQKLASLPWDKLDGAVKSDRWLEYVDNASFEVLQRWDISKELAEAGRPGMSGAVRPVAVSPDGHTLYFQVSFLHGYVVFDTQAPDLNGTTDYTLGGLDEPTKGAVVGVYELARTYPTMSREEYVNDSAHHGIAINEAGTKLCVAGTMDDYAAIVDIATKQATYLNKATTGKDYDKAYWSTEGLNNTCWVSLSDNDAVAVIDFATGQQLAYLPVGNHPQRVRHGYVPEALASTW